MSPVLLEHAFRQTHDTDRQVFMNLNFELTSERSMVVEGTPAKVGLDTEKDGVIMYCSSLLGSPYELLVLNYLFKLNLTTVIKNVDC